MHSIRKAARRDAWYHPTDHNRTYNPFVRLDTRVRPERHGDVEQGMRIHRAETDDVSPPDEMRRASTNMPRRSSMRSMPRRSYSAPVQCGKRVELLRQSSSPHCVESIPQSSANEMQSISQSGTSEVECNPAKPQDPTRSQAKKWLTQARKHIPGYSADDDPPVRKKKHAYIPICTQAKALFGTWISVLFAFVPAGFVVNYTNPSAVTTIFIVNFLAIIPSNVALGFAVEQVLLYVGNVAGGLISVSFGNAVQLISSILLLKTRQFDVLRSSLLGTMLQNLLLMTGLSFLLGGLQRTEQFFNVLVARTIGMFLLLAVLSLAIPTVSQLWGHSTPLGILQQSRGTAVIIIFSYMLWLLFQLHTHNDIFNEPSKKVPKKLSGKKEPGATSRGLASMGAVCGAAGIGGEINRENLIHEEEDEDEDIPQLSLTGAIGAMVFFTALLAVNTEYATNSLQGVMTSRGVSPIFMGIVVLPILSNEPLCIDSAIRDKMDISLALTLERCMQTALMVVPLIILIAWGMKIDEMTLDFDGFSVAALFVSIIVVTYVTQEGRSNWLTGALLIKVFVIVALGSWFTFPAPRSG